MTTIPSQVPRTAAAELALERREPDRMPAGTAPEQLVLALPLFNDWTALARLLPVIDDTFAGHRLSAAIVVIDDGSTEARPATFGAGPFQALSSVQVVTLRRNLGHQRAIAIGLAYIEQRVPCDRIILMDADGEDAPRDIPRLLDRCEREGGATIVFAERRRRAETTLFRLLYHAYRLLHRLLTGHGVRVGNFSVIPRTRLTGLVIVSELWNHYAAAVFRSRQPFVTVPTDRATRLGGRSHMNFVSLVVHGMSAISVYGDLVLVRLIVFASLLAALSVLGLCGVVVVRLFTDLAVPGWATFTSGLLILILTQAIMFMALLTFLGLGSRQQAPFVPTLDYGVYVASTWTAAATDRSQEPP
jgi:polyisoprenyl-phosphate glycosyltransferase